MNEYHNKNGILDKPQNYYQNNSSIEVNHVAEIDLAYISNSNDTGLTTTNYNFNIIYMNYVDFKICFFDSPLNNFNISNVNSEIKNLSIHQEYIDTTNNQQPFNLNSAVLYAWAEKNKSTISAIPVKEKILLNKNTNKTRNMGSFMSVQNALSFNEVIQTLLQSGEIKLADNFTCSCAIIDFKIFVQYNYKPLEIAIIMQYTYRIQVPGYVNKSDSNHCYSKDDTAPRKMFNFVMQHNNNYNENEYGNEYGNEDENEDENEQVYHNKINYEKNNKNTNEYFIDDNNTIITDSTNIMSQVSKILNSEDSLAESKKW